MKYNDLDDVFAIETVSFSSPWSRYSFECELQRETSVNLVATLNGQIVAYMIIWVMPNEIYIASVAVHPDWRKRGIGERLIRKGLAPFNNVSWIGLEVRSSNSAARNLYDKLGFKKAGVHKNYYKKEKEDAIVMVKIVSEK